MNLLFKDCNISLTRFNGFEPIAWGFNPRWMGAD
jgi:hypothetical protein